MSKEGSRATRPRALAPGELDAERLHLQKQLLHCAADERQTEGPRCTQHLTVNQPVSDEALEEDADQAHQPVLQKRVLWPDPESKKELTPLIALPKSAGTLTRRTFMLSQDEMQFEM